MPIQATRLARLMIACGTLTLLACANEAPALHRASAELVQRVSLERAWSEATGAHVPEVSSEGMTLTSGSTTARFDEVGAELSLADHPVRIHLAALGRETLRSVGSTPATIDGVEVRYERTPGVREWWRGLPSGLEHGVTIDERVAGEGRLVLELAVSGARALQVAEGVSLTTNEGERIGRYGGLVVLDARERRVPAALIASAEGIRIEVDDEAARYPLVIDPFVGVEEAVLRAPVPMAGEQLGVAVALDATGTRLVAGANHSAIAGYQSGRALVFVRSGLTWTFEAELTDPLAVPGASQGRSVAISAAGDRVLVGRSGGHPNVFSRTGTLWSLEATLPGVSESGGNAVALSADGSVAAIGHSYQQLGTLVIAGIVRVHRRVGSNWAFEQQLSHATPAAQDQFGDEVALSDDGSVLLVGCPGDDDPTNSGSAWVYRYTGPSWSAPVRLLQTAPANADGFGGEVALSGDGLWAVVGAPHADAGGFDSGAVYPFHWTGSAWDAQALVPGPSSDAFFGSSVTLTPDGGRMLVGASGDDLALEYTRSGLGWTEASRLRRPVGVGSYFGQSVDITRDGSRVAVGAHVGAGSVSVFADVAGTCTTDAECVSGHCSDGVCCDTACGGDVTNDCQACTAALTGGVDGRCAPLAVGVAAGVTCRAAAGDCDRAEVCTAGVVACPSDGFLSAATTCRPARDLCDAVEFCPGNAAACRPDLLRTAGTTCRSSLGVCDPLEVCDGTSDACPVDLRSTSVCRASMGACDLAESCDGIAANCPFDSHLGSETTCRAAAGPCDRAEVCTGGATCPADTFLTSVCRASEGLCDPAESCSGSSASCPGDARRPAGAVCRATEGVCDPSEVCDGSSVACPTDSREPSGTTCRASAGGCDPAEFCDGAEATCPGDLRTPSGEVCRISAGVCDSAEVCDGTSVACPGNTYEPSGTPCGGGEPGSCARANVCTGSAAECPDTMGVLPEGTICLAAPVGAACDIDDLCDGTSSGCEARFRDVTTACGPAPSGVCDAPDHCTGTSGDCEETFLDGVECRAASGTCDEAEFCTGSASCPPDAVLASGVSCRASTDATCDPVESCDGTSATCPADEMTCGEEGDAGPDHDGGARDAGADGGGPLAATGCACRVDTEGDPRAPVLVLGLLLVVIASRRRRAR